MAVNLLMPLLIPLGEQITNVTHLSNVGNLHFSQPWMEVTVRENLAPVLLLTLQASSNTSSKSVLYSIVSGGLNGLFLLNSHTGELTLTAPLDFEAKNKYEMIAGGTSGEERAFARVLIVVQDVNDLPPTFLRPLFETQITEEDDRHLPKPILLVAADDGDVSDRGCLKYTIDVEDETTSNDTFTITTDTGQIHLLRALDRDAPAGRPKWHVRVTATDGLHTAQAAVHVNVKDINDNGPFFPSGVINATVMENSEAGTEVIRVSAMDYDDPQEGTNAVLSYSVEKNVIDEHSGQPIFIIDPDSGVLRTARCCLDRERTPSYAIQVVAADGGGLKGTGTVVVTVGDENDVAPRFSRPKWLLTVHEAVPLNTTLALLTVEDPDITNQFLFKVLPGSGYGWERFQVVSVGNGSGALQLLKKLDYEDLRQREGFRFKVQVSDKGERGLNDSHHQSVTSVVVEVIDDNDNSPSFFTQTINLTLSEDVLVGTSLATFTATDLDQGDAGDVHYTIEGASDPDRQFVVDSLGIVRLRRPLDRETRSLHTVRVLAVDGGHPALTATASLLITVVDVNDNAPHVASPEGIHLPENSGPRHIASLRLDDADDWALGHGPPFKVSLDKDAPSVIKNSILTYFEDDTERGGTIVLKSLVAMDREESPTRLVPLVLSDAEGLTTTATITVTVADVNDNAMKPASKTISVTKFSEATGTISLGRIYVDDPDDWDSAEKSWAWNQKRHNLFSLDEHSGRIHMQGNASEGMYLLHFSVSDPTHGQSNVPANVTVMISNIPRDSVSCAVPVTITSHSPEALITVDQGTRFSPLDLLRTSMISLAGVDVSVVSLEGDPVGVPNTKRSHGTRLWLSARPVHPLDHLLLLHRLQVSRESGVEIVDVGVGSCVSLPLPREPSSSVEAGGGGGNKGEEKEELVWVVDANITALVTPRLVTKFSGCDCDRKTKYDRHHQHQHQIQNQVQSNDASASGPHPNVATVKHLSVCQSNPCLNGGRCIAGSSGPRCVCPAGTVGSICKQLSRYFGGSGWAWLAPIPPSPVAHITLEIRTKRKDCLVLYLGPRHDLFEVSVQQRHLQEDVLSLELTSGHPQLLLDLGTGPVFLGPANGSAVADDRWHRIDIFWGTQRAEMVVDLCQKKYDSCRTWVPLPSHDEGLAAGGPLQVGGLAYPTPRHRIHGWPSTIRGAPFLGCMRNLRINGELRDLGDGVLGEDSSPGCPDEDSCQGSGQRCPLHARCVERFEASGRSSVCECLPGWSSESCNQRTHPTSFGPKSYIKMALSSTPPTSTTDLQLRFRTWEDSSQMLAVTSQHGRALFTVHLMKGKLCVQLLLHPAPLTHLCLQRIHLSDGIWHNVRVQRYGRWVELKVDEGDGDFYNATPTPATPHGWVTKLEIDKQEGIHVGGSPEYVGVTLYTVHHDFHHGCLDDLRVSGVHLPLPPVVNTSSWAQATVFTNIQAACPGTSSVCANVSCPRPLVCVDLWRKHQCGCVEGAVLTANGNSCVDVNECLWTPCFNGGTCINKDPGYVCICSPSHVGDHCEGPAVGLPRFTISPGALAAILSWIFIVVSVVIVGGIIHKHFRQGKIHVKTLKNSVTLDLTGTDDMTSHSLDITRNILSDDKASTQPSPEVVDVDILNGGARDALQNRGGYSQTNHLLKKSAISTESSKAGCVCPHLPSVDDLRNYAYEGDGSSPGSLSSCCSGGDKIGERSFVGGFHDVATLLNCLGGQSTSSSPKLQKSAKPDKNSPNKSQDPSLPVLHLLHSPNRSQLTPDLTLTSSRINGILPNVNPMKKRDTDCLQKSIFYSSIKPKRPSLHDSKYNSLPKSKASHVFSNHLNEKELDASGKREPNGAYHSLQRNRSVFHLPEKRNVKGADERPGCSCEHKWSVENQEGNCASEQLTRAKCDACVMDTLVQQGIHKRSFSASTVFCLSPAYTCNSAALSAPTASAQGNMHSCWTSDDPFYK